MSAEQRAPEVCANWLSYILVLPFVGQALWAPAALGWVQIYEAGSAHRKLFKHGGEDPPGDESLNDPPQLLLLRAVKVNRKLF